MVIERYIYKEFNGFKITLSSVYQGLVKMHGTKYREKPQIKSEITQF